MIRLLLVGWVGGACQCAIIDLLWRSCRRRRRRRCRSRYGRGRGPTFVLLRLLCRCGQKILADASVLDIIASLQQGRPIPAKKSLTIYL